MSEKLFRTVFRGEVAPGSDPVLVRQELIALGVLDEGQAETAFAGTPVVLRDQLTRDRATKYCRALQAADAVCQVLPCSEPAEAAEESPRRVVWDGPVMDCPACGFEQPQGSECIKCGIVVSKYVPKAQDEAPAQPAAETEVEVKPAREELPELRTQEEIAADFEALGYEVKPRPRIEE